MRHWSDYTKSLEAGFSLIELLVAILISAVLMAAFTRFYISEQRAARHHQIEIETSQSLRTALEQMSRDLRSARKNLTRKPAPTFTTADVSSIEFQLDADDSGVVDVNDPKEHKGFRVPIGGTNLEVLDAPNTWNVLADNVVTTGGASGLTLTYTDCVNNALAAPVGSPNNIGHITISLTVTRPVIGGLPLTRTETETVCLRNVCACS